MSVANDVEAILKHFESCAALPGIALGLDRVSECLDRLGNPEKSLPPVIHIAGTNGKGSTLASMKAMLEANGKRVHCYTSPHLVRFHERIVLAGEPIDDKRLLNVLRKVRSAAGDSLALTFFEATTVAAFLAFAEVPSDVLLLEVGLGGRLDATNVVRQPLACVITPISYDHCEFLGDMLVSIAAEKAGIMKWGVPVFVADQPEEVKKVLSKTAKDVDAKLCIFGEDWTLRKHNEEFIVRIYGQDYALPKPALEGEHQFMNAALAYVTLMALSDRLGLVEASLVKGIGRTVWRARLQKLQRGPLTSISADVWLDGGHNPAAAHVLRQWVEKRESVGFIVGMLKRKDARGFFEALPLSAPMATIGMEGVDGFSAMELAELAKDVGCSHVTACEDILKAAKFLNDRGCKTLLIAGSLYLAGKVLENHA